MFIERRKIMQRVCQCQAGHYHLHSLTSQFVIPINIIRADVVARVML